MRTFIYLLTITCFFVSPDLQSQVPTKPFFSLGFEKDYYTFPKYNENKDQEGFVYVNEQDENHIYPPLKFDRGSRVMLQRYSSSTLTLPRFNFVGFKQVDLYFDLGAYCTNGKDGLDQDDCVRVDVKTEDSAQKLITKTCFIINGKGNMLAAIEKGDTLVWDYNDSCNSISIKGHTHFVLKNLPIEQGVDIAFNMIATRPSECWVLDNCELRGLREDSWGNYTSAQMQSVKDHKGNELALLGDWSAEQVKQLSDNLKPILPNLRELDITNADFTDDANIDYLLDGASQLCNVYASDMLPESFDGTFKGVNPNCLLHTTELSPQQGVNVVKGNYTDQISFVDSLPCRIHSNIKFHKASFIKNFPKEIESGYNGMSGGWQTISLPFRAIEFYALDRDGAEMKPFGINNGKDFDYDKYLPFWIKNTSEKGKYQNWDKIGANYPYIVSVPNNPAYQDRYRIWGRVSFAATDEYLWPTYNLKDKILKEDINDNTSKQFTFHPNVEGESLSRDIYTMNKEGSAFIKTSTSLPPFGSCLLFDGPQSEAPDRVNIMSDGAIVSSILKPEKVENRGIKVVQVGTYLKITSEIDQKVRICNLQGFIVKTLSLRANQEQCVSLVPGIYLINNKKIQQF